MNPSDIRILRKAWGMTQAELACQLGVARETVSRWENGREAPLPSLLRMLREIGRTGGG